jgi:hypothetical protein
MAEPSLPRIQRRPAARVRGMCVKLGSKYDCTLHCSRIIWVWPYWSMDVRVLSSLCHALRPTPLGQLQREIRTICARWVRRWPHWLAMRSSSRVVQIQSIGSLRDCPAVLELRGHCVSQLQPVGPARHAYWLMRRREHWKSASSKSDLGGIGFAWPMLFLFGSKHIVFISSQILALVALCPMGPTAGRFSMEIKKSRPKPK